MIYGVNILTAKYLIIPNMSIRTVLGNNIKRLRLEKNISQKELAAKLNCSVKHLSSIENGHSASSLDFIEETAHILKVSYSVLFSSAEDHDSATVYSKMDRIIDAIAADKANEYKALLRK